MGMLGQKLMVHGGYGFGRRNVDGEMLLEFADALDFAIVNTWFKKEVRKMITYETKACKTVIDFFLIRKSERKLVRDVKVVHEECITQHKLLICVLDLKEKLVRSKVKFMKRCKVWKLKEAETESIFRQKVQARVAMSVGKPRDAEGVWKDLKECMLSEAIGVCGETKGISRHKETWWWNDEVAALVQEKKRLFREWKGPRKCKCQERCRCKKRCRCGTCKCRKKTSVSGHPQDENADLETRKENYNRAKRAAKLAIFNAKNAERLKFCEELENENRKGNVFRVAKQLVRKNKDVVGAGYLKDNVGKIVVEEDKLLVGKSIMIGYLMRSSAWDREGLTDVRPVCGPGEKISEEEVEAAISKMKLGKAGGPSGVVADMLKAAGDEGTRWMTELCNAVVRDGKIPKDWSRSWLVNVYKGKGDALACGSYRGIKLVEHAMKVLERVIERRVRNIVKIDEIFIVHQVQEKYLARNKELWMAFVDLEKAFDRVSREVVWRALRCLGVDEWIVSVIKAMYEDATTTMRVNGRESKAFSVRVGVHQGSVLSPLLFILVLEALSREFREGLPMELLYADDLVLVAETEELLMEKLRKWKRGMELKGLRVNIGKTKVMRCQVRIGQAEETGKYGVWKGTLLR